MKTLANTGLDYLAHDDVERALPLFDEALELARELDASFDVLRNQSNLGYARLVAGDAEGARTVLMDAAQRARDLDDPYPTTVVQFNLGLALVRCDDVSGAYVSFRETLRVAEEHGIRYGIAMAALGLA